MNRDDEEGGGDEGAGDMQAMMNDMEIIMKACESLKAKMDKMKLKGKKAPKMTSEELKKMSGK